MVATEVMPSRMRVTRGLINAVEDIAMPKGITIIHR